ncbi:TetR/AcrR family transcriptional regulator [Enterobacteriaceae bacterium 4M9]|nr:TetR/AcrR family transcriptional regulator [Enterobacteriaceae bacterium 4M9]
MRHAHHRPKDPQALRLRLLHSAAQIIAAAGLTGLTLDKVVRHSGVSKGGLQHHFASKQALVDGVFAELQQRFLDEINHEIAQEPEHNGRATRAYIRVCARRMSDEEQEINRVLMASMLAEPALRACWANFINHRLPQDDGNAQQNRQRLLCRLAADGLWFATLCGYHQQTPEQRLDIINHLLVLAERAE